MELSNYYALIGSWTYDGFEIDLVHYDTDRVEYKLDERLKWAWRVTDGIDLSDFYTSVEWDILGVPGDRHAETYANSPAPYYDITYTINLRRKTLFYTINLIVPCVGISFLATLVFYLPSDSGEKVTERINKLISITLIGMIHLRLHYASQSSFLLPFSSYCWSKSSPVRVW